MIPLFYPSINKKECLNELKDTLSGRWIGEGPKVKKFEKEFSKKFGFKYCIAVNSGTAALHLAYILAGIKKGDEVLSSVLTCTATHHPLLWLEAKIKFVDIDPETLNMDVLDLENKMTEKTKAIVFTALGGSLEELDKVKDYNFPIIIDACQALGQEPIYGNYIAFSFQAIKNLTTGDGGMLVVRNKKDYERAKRLRWFDIDRDKKIKRSWQAWDRRGITFQQEEIGYKYQMTDIDASIGLVGLKDFDKNFKRRKKIVAYYNKHIVNPLVKKIPSGNWLYMVLVNNRDGFAYYLKKNGIETNVAHIRNDIFKVFGGKRQNLPNMNGIEFQYLCIPLHPNLTPKDIKHICNIINQWKE